MNKYFNNQSKIKFFKNEKYVYNTFKKDNMFFSKNNELNEKNIFKEFRIKKDEFIKKLNYKRLSDIYPKYYIFEEEIICCQFKQTYLGNCYIVDCMALLSNYNQVITQLFRFDKKTENDIIKFIYL